jgi:hypothetical protein
VGGVIGLAGSTVLAEFGFSGFAAFSKPEESKFIPDSQQTHHPLFAGFKQKKKKKKKKKKPRETRISNWEALLSRSNSKQEGIVVSWEIKAIWSAVELT